MSKNETTDRIDLYTRTLVLEGPTKAHLYASPILPEEKSLFETIDMLWEAMQPVEPDDEFVDSLHAQLIEEAGREQAMEQLGFRQKHSRMSSPWIASAAIASAAVVGAAATLAGAFAYWKWSASRQAA